MNKIKSSIIIRCKNEEDWIGHCLQSVYKQGLKNFEVIIVDSGSTDKTLEIVRSFKVDHIIKIKDYKPGYAINEGAKIANGEVLVMLSSHCVVKGTNWLRDLIENFKDPSIAGVYGRQLPVTFSSPTDVRDLFITFGLDKRIQVQDYFFHNANSAIKKKIWDRFPFDDEATNIEDRIWGKKVTDAGFNIVYEPSAEVFHHHGIHHGQSDNRARSTFQILKQVESFDSEDALPDSLKPENREIVAIIPIKEDLEEVGGINPINNLMRELDLTEYISKVVIISSDEIFRKYQISNKFIFFQRPDDLYRPTASLGEVLQWGLRKINSEGVFPDYVIYANPDYLFRLQIFFQGLFMMFVTRFRFCIYGL